jgi:ligand-binding sensor domain-containing protein
VFSVIRIGALVLLNISLAAQGLPDLIFQNIDLWAERNGAIQVIEDTEGYLWMTSAMGVHRFDGKHVRSYFQQSDTLSISANYTEMLFEDREQNIWIGTTLGGVHEGTLP